MDKITKNHLFTAPITGWSHDGEGIAKLDGLAVFVRGAARGDLCELRIQKALKNRAYARVERLLSASDCRVENDCPAFPRCGGCDFRHISYAEELELKARRVSETLRRIGHIDMGEIEIVPSKLVNHSRNKGQFPVKNGENGLEFGFFRRRSHDIVPITHCPACDERASALARAVCRWADQSGVRAYDEVTGAGFLRHIHARSGEKGTHLCLITAPGKMKNTERLIELARAADPSLCGISRSVNAEKTNRIMGGPPTLLWGGQTLEARLCGNLFGLSPHSFFQVNTGVAEDLYAEIVRMAGGGSLAVDLYCGAGTITLALAPSFERVVGIEIVPDAIENAVCAARDNDIRNVEYLCADAPGAAGRLPGRPELVVCDPPRKGLGAAGVAALCTLMAKRLIYVACDPASLARDGAMLAEAGYVPRAATAFDMFPRTANVETVMLFELE